jgi:hypothetical protein
MGRAKRHYLPGRVWHNKGQRKKVKGERRGKIEAAKLGR